MKLTITDEAVGDLGDIWSWIGVDDVAAADRYVASLLTQSERLLEFPELGRSRDDLSPGAQALVHGRCLIVYRFSADELQILRFVMGERDLSDLF